METDIRIFITGGTIDLVWYKPATDEWEYKDSFIPKMLKQAHAPSGISTEKLMLKDSREITEEDRALILKKCSECSESRIVITHGTFTIPETARFLGEKVKGKTIVLTGALKPFNEGSSDALFNLGSAITAAQTLQSGVYVAMNGRIFKWYEVDFDKIHPK